MGARRGQMRGVIGTLRSGRVRTRALAIADSRSLVRSLFLASAVRMDVLPFLRPGRRFSEIADYTGCIRQERLQAWLWIGSELGEISFRGERFGVRGHRAHAIADGDRLLVAHYRSMLDYQIGPYGDLEALLRSDSTTGRADLDRYADDIAQVSLAALPFVATFVSDAVIDLHPNRVLDVGCGTGVYSRTVLDADPHVHVEGIDLDEGVIGSARAELLAAGYGPRVEFGVGDVRTWETESHDRFGLVMLANNIYYFDKADRVALYRHLGEFLTDGGQLLVVSMLVPGSLAAAHLHFMLTCQATHASLPRKKEIENDLITAGFRILTSRTLVPTEPLVGVRAVRA
jgi:SAM-dependent methyltransferase